MLRRLFGPCSTTATELYEADKERLCKRHRGAYQIQVFVRSTRLLRADDNYSMLTDKLKDEFAADMVAQRDEYKSVIQVVYFFQYLHRVARWS